MVVVSVNDRSQRDLTKRFENTDVDWAAIERQLLRWKALFTQGKRLRVTISINFLEDSNAPASQTSKRGASSVTRRMLGEREARIDAEHVSGQPSAWRDVYRIMRCPGRPCHHNGQFCWLDPVGKRHYKLLTHHMKSIVEHVEKGGVLEIHDDVPYNVRARLYAEEQKQLENTERASQHPTSGPMCPPININVHPTQEARDVTLENCLDLKQIFRDRDPSFFVKQGVRISVACRFVSNISLWLEHCAQKDGEDRSE